MKNSFVVVLLLAIIFSACNHRSVNENNESFKTYFWLGSYTDGNSKGIYQYSLSDSGIVKLEKLAAISENPSFLTKSADGKFLLVVNENSSEGKVSLYQIIKDSLVFVNSQISGGEHPCYITINQNNTVLTANYSSGSIGLHNLSEENTLSELLFKELHTGKSSHERQQGPHAHSVYFLEDDWVVSADLGSNQLWFSRLDSNQSILLMNDSIKISLPEGSGPRHLAITKAFEQIYVLNELSSTITLLQKDSGVYYRTLQHFSTLPVNFEGENLAADIHLSSDERFVYASNRGHNSIAVFERNIHNGSLQLVAHEIVRGEWPRNFALSPDNSFLLVANQHSNNIVVFKRNPENGTLQFVSETEAFAPVSILF